MPLEPLLRLGRRKAPRQAARGLSILVLAGLAGLLSACIAPSCDPEPGRPVHHGPLGFCNPPGSAEPTASLALTVADNLRLVAARHRGPVPAGFVRPEAEILSALRDPGPPDRVTWLGHATVLLRIGGRTVLADPVWSRYVTPLPPFGPERAMPPPVPLAALPPVDVLLVTHDHYDHLDLPTLRQLPGKARTEVIVPLGLGPALRRAGFPRVRELDWWQSARLGDLTVWMLPAQHESGRSLLANRTLWGSVALVDGRAGGARVYLSGDSGYGPHFARIGERLGPFDLAVMNVGGYGPPAVAEAYHFRPEDGARALGDLRAKLAVPAHWGTYPLGAEPVFASGPLFAEAARAAGTGPVRLLRIGESLGFGPAADPPRRPRRAAPASAGGS